MKTRKYLSIMIPIVLGAGVLLIFYHETEFNPNRNASTTYLHNDENDMESPFLHQSTNPEIEALMINYIIDLGSLKGNEDSETILLKEKCLDMLDRKTKAANIPDSLKTAFLDARQWQNDWYKRTGGAKNEILSYEDVFLAFQQGTPRPFMWIPLELLSIGIDPLFINQEFNKKYIEIKKLSSKEIFKQLEAELAR